MEQRMPLARYFFFVGGVLLALLFISDAYLPKFPIVDRANADRPVIRIQSNRKWPERVVYDTSLPTIIPAGIASLETRVPTPARADDVFVKTREREAFAQLQSSEAKQLQLSEAKNRESRLQRERKIARRHAVPPIIPVARQTQFSLFGNSIW
jgi:hypothetical protein